MSSSTVARLKGLLEKLEALNIQEHNPQLEAQLAAVAAAAQTEIDRHQHGQRAQRDGADDYAFAEALGCLSLENAEPPMNMVSEPSTTVIVDNLSFTVTEDAARSFFSECGGRVKNVRFPTDRATGQLKGYGCVEFEYI
ncbi:RNA-binding domain-containing protein [Mycena sanguinolenta]|uniref:RNA-binding domain-containing protein n=1 Tax=Mycena sanguinolenta TaxID=230812 RepID=A0A8H6XN41_9AGAR|nr:RNA-binding domain-containing protein [Mycena sanguinolenta]